MAHAYSKIKKYISTFKAIGFKRSLKTVQQKLLSKPQKAQPTQFAEFSDFKPHEKQLSFFNGVRDFSACLEPEVTNWHCDPQLKKHDHFFCFNPNLYYKDIKITPALGKDLGPDIRNIWQMASNGAE